MSVVTVGGESEERVVRLVASLERGSEHPLAGAVVEAALGNGLSLIPVEEFRSLTGRGVTGRVGGHKVAAGNEALLQELNFEPQEIKELQEKAEGLRKEGQTVIFAVINGHASGLLGIADPVKPEAAQAIRDLRELGLKVVMLTGDSPITAAAVASSLASELRSRVLPETKPKR